jgi:phage-related protein
MFCVEDGRIVVLHGFVKKSQKTPEPDMALARKRKKEFES